MKTISDADAQALEDFEVVQLQQQATLKAINNTYDSEFVSKKGRVSHSPFTKKRRQLPGKRKWKNKTEQYKEIRGVMSARYYNTKQKADAALRTIYKNQSKLRLVDDE